MITVMREMITVINENDYSDNHRNHWYQKACRLQSNHCNHDITKIKGGQSIIEYTMFIAVVVLALLAMQVYLKRGLQGKVKDMADQISPALYNPNLTISDYSTNTSSETQSHYDRGTFTQDIIYENTSRTGTETVLPETVPFL